MSTLWSRRIHLRAQAGLTLLEMILFIVVLGVAGVALLSTLSAPLTGAGEQTRALTAAQVVQARMELVLGQKRKAGYPEDVSDCKAALDPCPGATLSACALPAGWSEPAVSCEAWNANPTDEYVVVVVSAAGPDGTSATARTLITNLGGG
ncbi:type II secretion system protein [Wenzhouxiangella sp. EGI_FJ10305]|uniref:type II secretion system protein n=1 Tax=Wenzhouxiangella sp. EGI_FJ10305 TaxID=3243768 RepID=UPI0035D5BA2E